ncbi:hypothetical protein [Methylobacter sp.]|uniref:hypothetical protein n=1 Tax=Methylobacter sp. TaxID=2051955 RepID=UPI003DA341D5
MLEWRRWAFFAGFTEKRLAKFMPSALMVLAMLRIGSTCRLGWSFSGNPAWVAEMLGLPTQPTALSADFDVPLAVKYSIINCYAMFQAFVLQAK